MTLADLRCWAEWSAMEAASRRSAGSCTGRDVVIVNKMEINEQTIGTARNLKLVCVTATGTNNLDKKFLEERNIAWAECGRLFYGMCGTAYICAAVLSA